MRRVTEKPSTRPIFFRARPTFPIIPAKSEQRADIQLCFQKRGHYQQEGFGLRTRFPFAFLSKTRRVPLQREITVFPRVEPTDEFFQILPLITGEMESFVRGRGNDLYRIREYTSEDSARHVDWKATAKSGMLKVREFTREDERKLRIVFDNPSAEQVDAQAIRRRGCAGRLPLPGTLPAKMPIFPLRLRAMTEDQMSTGSSHAWPSCSLKPAGSIIDGLANHR